MRVNSFDGVIIFVMVADKRSFTPAADALGVTTAAVSTSIKRLEARIGVKLLTRTTRSVELTIPGAIFLKHVGPSVSHVNAAMAAMQPLRELRTGND